MSLTPSYQDRVAFLTEHVRSTLFTNTTPLEEKLGLEQEMFVVRPTGRPETPLANANFAELSKVLLAQNSYCGHSYRPLYDQPSPLVYGSDQPEALASLSATPVLTGLALADGSLLSFEPGSQLEISTRTYSSVQALEEHFTALQLELDRVLREQGYSLVQQGLHPVFRYLQHQ